MANDDKKVVEKLLDEDYGDWISEVRGLLCQEDSPLSLKNGTWSVEKRQEMWQELGPYLFDEHLDKFRKIAVEVLRDPGPQFELRPDKRYMADISGKTLEYSSNLRKGLAETLALLGTQPEALNKCSSGKAETTGLLAIRKIFENSDAVLWGSLNTLMPILAEAAPVEFLSAVENTLKKMPCPFDELFAQQGIGLTGRNYMTGLLWALENLAWAPEYLVQVTVLLGKLAKRDPGGNWVNRPINSLITIFLPWMPQTSASSEKRKVAVQAIIKESPDEGWKLLLNLLPNECGSSSGSHKPEWRKLIPDDWEESVTKQEYWEQVVDYSEMAVEIAKSSDTKLEELVTHLQNLAEPSFDTFLEYLETEEVKSLSEEKRTGLWDALNKIIIRKRWHKNSGRKGMSAPETVKRMEQVAETLRAKSPQHRCRHLFGNSIALYEKEGNYEEQEKKLEGRRQDAIKEILEEGGVEAVLHFVKNVDTPHKVGHSLGIISKDDIDGFILPRLIEDEGGTIRAFTSAFVFAKHRKRGWQWFDQLSSKEWSKEKVGIFLSYLPSSKETWDYATRVLGEHEDEYWKRASVYPSEETSDWDYAIGKLIRYKRPNAAITCLNAILHKKKKMNITLATKALLDALSTEDSLHEFDSYNTTKVIQALQDDPEVNPDDLLRIEWRYLRILTGPGKGATPKLLEHKLASEPEFFCELIRLIYRSKNESETRKEATEQDKAIAANAWGLLREWKRIPGMDRDRKFSSKEFNEWLQEVKTKCEKSGHFDVAMTTLGEALIHSPSDPDGLWIHKTVAEALNLEDTEPLRRGYSLGIMNSRGVYMVDPTGKPENELAAKYRQQAEEIENAGFHRFASILKGLAKTYEKEAKRIVEEHGNEIT